MFSAECELPKYAVRIEGGDLLVSHWVPPSRAARVVHFWQMIENSA